MCVALDAAPVKASRPLLSHSKTTSTFKPAKMSCLDDLGSVEMAIHVDVPMVPIPEPATVTASAAAALVTAVPAAVAAVAVVEEHAVVLPEATADPTRYSIVRHPNHKRLNRFVTTHGTVEFLGGMTSITLPAQPGVTFQDDVVDAINTQWNECGAIYSVDTDKGQSEAKHLSHDTKKEWKKIYTMRTHKDSQWKNHVFIYLLSWSGDPRATCVVDTLNKRLLVCSTFDSTHKDLTAVTTRIREAQRKVEQSGAAVCCSCVARVLRVYPLNTIFAES